MWMDWVLYEMSEHPPSLTPIGPSRPRGEWRLRRWTWACSRSWGWVKVEVSYGASFASAARLLSPAATVQPSYPNPRRCGSLPWAVVSALSMTRTMVWRTNADGVRVRIVGCCWDTGVWSWPAAGQVWCKSSWASSWAWPSAAGALRKHDKRCCCRHLLHCCRHCNHTDWRPTGPASCWDSGPGL